MQSYAREHTGWQVLKADPNDAGCSLNDAKQAMNDA
jgi:hypothetical protein